MVLRVIFGVENGCGYCIQLPESAPDADFRESMYGGPCYLTRRELTSAAPNSTSKIEPKPLTKADYRLCNGLGCRVLVPSFDALKRLIRKFRGSAHVSVQCHILTASLRADGKLH